MRAAPTSANTESRPIAAAASRCNLRSQFTLSHSILFRRILANHDFLKWDRLLVEIHAERDLMADDIHRTEAANATARIRVLVLQLIILKASRDRPKGCDTFTPVNQYE